MKFRYISLLATLTSAAHSAPVALQNATATFSQPTFAIAQVIDENPSTGWAIDDGGTDAQTAAFELVTPLSSDLGFSITVTLVQDYGFHHVGRFRLSVTGDDRSTFADGLSAAGDVTANWFVLSPSSVGATNGVDLAILGDDSVLASGTRPLTTSYTFSTVTGQTNITGVRLEVLADASLPTGGPGRMDNGNLVLSEFVFDVTPVAIPEPSSAAVLFGLGAGLFAVSRRRR